MRWNDIYLDSAAAVLGELQTSSEALELGLLRPEDAHLQKSVSVSHKRSGPELAVTAGHRALESSSHENSDVGILIHANCWRQGIEFWNTAAYVQNEVLGHGACVAFELRQMSNGGMCALDMAAARLAAIPSTAAAMVTTGDQFAAPSFLRWNTDRGLAFGDAGTSVVLSRQTGMLRLVATGAWSDPFLERLHRGDVRFDESRLPGQDGPLDLASRKKSFMRSVAAEDVTTRNETGMLTAVKNCLNDADATMQDMATIVLPFLGSRICRLQYLEPLGLQPSDTLMEWGLTTGHLGAGDQLAGVDRLLKENTLARGEKVLLVGVGAGFNWTCAVLEKV